MKTTLFITLQLLLVLTNARSQVAQKKIQGNIRPGVMTTAQPILLNVHDKRYQQAKINSNAAIGVTRLVIFSKTISFSDNSKVHISLRKNPSFAGQGADVKASVKPVDEAQTPGLVCTTNRVALSATSTDFMNNNYSPQTAHIYPGAIYTYEHLYDGSFREETADRNPILIGSDNPNMSGDVFETVSSPNQMNIDNAIAKLYRRFTGPAANESTAYQVFESYNSSDLSIKIGASGSAYGFSFSNLFNTQNQEQHLYLTIDARKTLFTISTNTPDSGYFKNNVNSSSPLVVMGSVSYGVRVLANLDYTFKSKQDMDAFKANYNGFGASGHVDLNVLSSSTAASTTVNAYVIGGAGAASKISFNKDELKDQVDKILANANYQNARAISYELFDLSGNVIGEQSATDEFTVRQCVPAGLLQSPRITFQTGGDDKDKDTHYTVQLFTSSNKLAATYTNNSNTDAYADNTSRAIEMLTNSVTLKGTLPQVTPINTSPEEFGNGGHLHLAITPNGHDTWRIGNLVLSLSFTNDIHSPHVVTWNNVVMSQDSREIDLYFDSGFHQQ